MTFISRCWEDGEAIPTSSTFAHPRATCKTFQTFSQCLVRHQNMQFFSFCLKVICNGKITHDFYISLYLFTHAMHKKHVFNN